MSRVIPSTLTLPTHDDHLPQDVVKKSKWNEILEALHYHYQRSGAIVPGLTFDDPWQTTSTSYVGANANGDVNLDTWCGIWKFARPVINASGDTVYSMQFDAYIENCDLRFNWARYDSRDSFSTSVATGNVVLSSTSGDSEWIRETVEFTEAEAYESGSTSNDLALFYVYVEAKVPSSGTANIWHLGALEERISADALPGESEGDYVPFGLTQDQFENQNLRLAVRAKSDMVWDLDGSSLPTPPSDGGLADNDDINTWIDAGPDGANLDCPSKGAKWVTTSAESDATKAIKVDGTASDILRVPDSTAAFTYLHQDTGWTVLLRVAIGHALSNGALDLISTRSFPGNTKGMTITYGAGSGELIIGIHDGTNFESVDYVTWTGFTEDQLYTIAARHTASGVTELFIDDLGTPVASATLTNWTTGTSSDNLSLGEDRTPVAEYAGAVIAKGTLTQTEMEAWETWINEPQ